MSSENPKDAGSTEPQSDLPPSQGEPSTPSQGEPPTKEETNMAMLAHLTGGLGALIGLGFVGPLVIWLMKKEESRFIEDQGREALNFQLTWLIAYIVSGVIGVATCILLFLPFIVVCIQLVFGIIGAMKASNGELYRYPITLRMIK